MDPAYENETRAPRLLAATWSLTIVAGIFLALRMYCKRRRSTGLWWDDHLMIAAWFSLATSVSINTYLTTLGMGRHYSTISREDKISINKVTILVALFGIMASGLSKTSFCVTLYRLFSDKWMRFFLLFVVVTVNLFLNSVWITGYLKCQPTAKVFDSSIPGTCWDKSKLSKWQTFASYYSSIIDFVLAFLPWKTLLGMTMPLREKIGVTVAMSMGAIAGITGIVKSVLVVAIADPDVTYSRVDLTIWTIAEPAVTIMAASLPVLRMLYREFRSSQRSYYRNGVSTNRYGKSENQTGKRNTMAGQSVKPHRKGNTVHVMSTAGWQESQEALQRDLEVGTGTPRNGSGVMSPHGIMKTEEVRIQTSLNTTGSTADSFEMESFEKERR
ncbi:hypothetical protein PG989_016574 [Apiospora arundinis]|uniref:Integral membrane protein pth11 n=1 Tax=Apiospora arundinis TaxID=335852 RepID=A0ABR2JFK6_9PEZI